MKIEYRKLASQDDFSQCVELQRSIFGLSDLDIVSPLILQLIARENPPMGIALGAFNVSEELRELVGFIISMATFQERSMYGAIMGVKPQYQNQGHALNLFLKLREIGIKEGIDYFYGVFEPLEKKLAHLYINHLGFVGIRYQETVYYQSTVNENGSLPMDKFLLRWDLKAYSTHDRNRNNSKELLDLYPIATKDNMPELPYVFVEIPSDFGLMRKEDINSALFWRQSTGYVFSHYINQHNYIVYDCLTFEENLIKKSYYLLKAQ